MTFLSMLALGFFLGMRHATDADHVVAITAIVSRERSTRAAMRMGALWGLGHTATILVVGGAIVVFGLAIPPRLGLSMEMCVAVMLVVLGIMNLTGTMRRIDKAAHDVGHDAERAQALRERTAPGLTTPHHTSRIVRPVIVGLVHGLAGSAAVALLVLASIRVPMRALVYLLVFGAGTVLGMMMLTGAMVFPLAAIAKRFGSVERGTARLTGVASVAFGLYLAYEIGVVSGLFSAAPSWSPR